MHGGVGTNSMKKDFLEKYNLSFDCREDFLAGIDKVIDREVDIFIGNHTWNNDTKGKYEKLIAGDKDAFVNKSEWKEFLEGCKESVLKMMEEEK